MRLNELTSRQRVAERREMEVLLRGVVEVLLREVEVLRREVEVLLLRGVAVLRGEVEVLRA